MLQVRGRSQGCAPVFSPNISETSQVKLRRLRARSAIVVVRTLLKCVNTTIIGGLFVIICFNALRIGIE